MQVSTNDLGQTLVHLTRDEWEDYGRLAGYIPEMTKEANKEEPKEIEEEVEIEEVEEEIEEVEKPKEIKKSSFNGGINNQILIREETSFNQKNYPNLIAEQERDGLIGPFSVRH